MFGIKKKETSENASLSILNSEKNTDKSETYKSADASNKSLAKVISSRFGELSKGRKLLLVGLIAIFALGALGAVVKVPGTQQSLLSKLIERVGLKEKSNKSFSLNPFAPDPTPTLQLSKEYVYAGSRMLAIEDYGVSNASATQTPTATPTPGDSSTFNAVNDFSAASNPSGAWSYGQKASLSAAFAAFTAHGQQWTGIDNWSMNSGGQCCAMIAKNSTGSTQTYVGQVTQPADLLNLHPGPSGELATVKWTAPAAGTYQVQGRFEGLDTTGTTTDVHVLHNNTSVYSGNISGFGNQAAYNLTLTVAAGDVIEFAVGVGSGYSADSTGLAVTITPASGGSTPTPTPTSTPTPTATPTPAGNTATFVQADSTTQGNWVGVYGGQGYQIAGDSTSLPSWAQISFTGESPYTWASTTTDSRALTKASNNSDRIAATWYTYTNYDINFNFTDGQAHKIALYCLDWDTNNGRAQKLEVIDATTNTILDTRTATSFNGGVYYVWQVTGNVKVRVTNQGANAVVSGVFINAS